jgi:hypothetical protein
LAFGFVFELVLAVDYPLAVIQRSAATKDLSSIAAASRLLSVAEFLTLFVAFRF